jgi:hypothetical protein
LLSPAYVACKLCVPVAGTVMVTLAVVPPVSGALPTAPPSSVKLTVPVGTVLPESLAVKVAVTSSELPPRGVVVAGVTASVVDPLDTRIGTVAEFAVL